MLIKKTEGPKSVAINYQKYHTKSTFQLIGTAAEKAAMTADIVFEQPAEEWDEPFDPAVYTGTWEPITQRGDALVLNADNHLETIYGAAIIRVTKSTTDSVAVACKW